jgi:hypothetical protein
MSVTLATSSGSVENLNVSTRHGATPTSRQALATAGELVFQCVASSREDQCVTPYFRGGGSNVAAMILRLSTIRGRPGRGLSSRPASPERS